MARPRSDKSDGPTAGTETADPLKFLARVLVHIPDKGHVTTRYYGWDANRTRGMRRQAEPATANAPPVIVPVPRGWCPPRPPAGVRAVGDHAVYSTDAD